MASILPVETWRTILRHATEIPGSLDTGLENLIQVARRDRYRTEQYGTSMVTKRSVVRVCSMWNDIGMEYLYEDVRPRSMRFWCNLKDSGRDSRSHQVGYGGWVRRIELFPDAYNQPANEGIDIPSMLSKYCPNLDIFILHAAEQLKSTMNHNATNSPPPELSVFLPRTLKSLIVTGAFPHWTIYWPEVTVHHSDLQILDVTFPIPGYEVEDEDGPESEREPPPQKLPHLHTLRVDLAKTNSSALSWHYPSLRHVTISNLVESDKYQLLPFFRRHASQLVSVRLDALGAVCYSSHFLPELVACSPGLQELILHPGNTIFPAASRVTCQITTLGLLGKWRNATESAITRADTSFTQFQDRKVFPQLNRITFMDERQPHGGKDGKLPQEWWIKQIATFAAMGIRCEDSYGRSMTCY